MIAGILRFFAPVGSVVICSAIAIMAEGVVFEIIMSRPQFTQGSRFMKEPRSLVYLGIILGYTIFVTGYITTLVLTPVLGSESGSLLDVVSALPLVLGRGFFAALLGGVSMPLAALAPQLDIDIARVKKELYYTISTATSAFCWLAIVVLFYYPGVY